MGITIMSMGTAITMVTNITRTIMAMAGTMNITAMRTAGITMANMATITTAMPPAARSLPSAPIPDSPATSCLPGFCA